MDFFEVTATILGFIFCLFFGIGIGLHLDDEKKRERL